MALAPKQFDFLVYLAGPPARRDATPPPAPEPAPAPGSRSVATRPLNVAPVARPVGPPPLPPPLPVRPLPASADVLSLPGVPGPRQTFQRGPLQPTISVQRRADGKPVFTAPPPPVTDITFSGGGGKGAALPGAVRALQDAHVLDQVRKVSGASVGSMTAAMIAAGMTAEEFERAANDPATSAAIMEGHGATTIKAGTFGGLFGFNEAPLSGAGLQGMVRKLINETLRRRLTEYLQAHQPPAAPADPRVLTLLQKISSDSEGATFLDMRQLSAIIPAIKEVVITGTFVEAATAEREAAAVQGIVQAPGPDEPTLYVFDADSEPDMMVSQAVQASAAFPGAFKPVFLTLASGVRAKFIDGGVLNNTPTTSTLGQDRKLDPIPQSRGMTFVFEDEDGNVDQLLKGVVKPAVGKAAQFKDWLVGAPNAAAEYATARDLADQPDQLVKVPLKFTATVGGKTKKLDYTGTPGGTLNFDMPLEEKQVLQQRTQAATAERIRQQGTDRSQVFDSDDEMFMAVAMPDLQAMVQGGYPQAAQALAFRQQVAAQLAAMQGLQADLLSLPLEQASAKLAEVADVLDGLKTAGHGNAAFNAYVARELNRGPLDGLVRDVRAQLAKGAAPAAVLQRLRSNPVCEAALATRAVLDLRQHVRLLEMNLIYPYMKKLDAGGSGLSTLIAADDRLRKATTPAQFNDALELAIQHFARKRDLPPKTGHAAFAAALREHRLDA